MKYYLIAGEASGDLHASNLMKALKAEDPEAEFRFFGGDLMQAVGGTCVKHYREMAYMGFIPVLKNLRTILRNMRLCKRDIRQWKPDVVILVDYPGFNLKIAHYVKHHTKIPVFYYILPKVWAWKTYRIRSLKRNVDARYSILPFEVDFYKKHKCEIEYVGNPTVDEVEEFRRTHPETYDEFRAAHGLTDEDPLILLMPGSRKAEIERNLPLMIQFKQRWDEFYQFAIAGAPGIDEAFYRQFPETIGRSGAITPIFFGETYRLLQQAEVAFVTSGTATLEAALFDVPQVVCYALPHEKIVNFLRRCFLKVKYISLVNLIAGREVVYEFVQAPTEQNYYKMDKVGWDICIHRVMPWEGDPDYEEPPTEEDRKYWREQRQAILDGYKEMRDKLGPAGSFERAARSMVQRLKNRQR